MNTGNHIEGNTYTRAFLLNLVAAREVGRSWVYIASYLNQQGKYPVLSARWTDANVGQVVTRFIDKEAAKIVATDEEGEPNFTMDELINHPNYNHIIGRLNAIRDTSRQIDKLVTTRHESYATLDKLVRG